MGSHPVPGTTLRREAEELPRKRLRMGGEEEEEEQEEREVGENKVDEEEREVWENKEEDAEKRKKLNLDDPKTARAVEKELVEEEEKSPKEKCAEWVKKAEESGFLFVPAQNDDEEYDEDVLTLPLQNKEKPIEVETTVEEKRTKEADIEVETLEVVKVVKQTKEVDKTSEETTNTKPKSRKTLKESRAEKPKVKSEDTISKVDKKTFKEAFNTDKTRLDKRQLKLGKPQNFLLLVEDNIGSAVCTSGKYMAYGRGKLAEDFFGGGIKYDKDNFYVHKNSHNFEEDKTLKETVKETVEEDKNVKESVKKTPEDKVEEEAELGEGGSSKNVVKEADTGESNVTKVKEKKKAAAISE